MGLFGSKERKNQKRKKKKGLKQNCAQKLKLKLSKTAKAKNSTSSLTNLKKVLQEEWVTDSLTQKLKSQTLLVNI